jgi:hypothetical protein
MRILIRRLRPRLSHVSTSKLVNETCDLYLNLVADAPVHLDTVSKRIFHVPNPRAIFKGGRKRIAAHIDHEVESQV